MPKIFHPLRALRPARTLLGLLLRRPIVGTSVIARMPDGRIVLVLRRDSGLWGLPGGMVDWDEDIKTAAGRELAEETGLTMTAAGRLVGVYSDAERDPRFHSVCVLLEAQAEGSLEGFDVDEVLAVKAFADGELPLDEMAHDHKQQLQDYFAGKTVLS